MLGVFKDMLDRAEWSDRFFYYFDDCGYDVYEGGKNTEQILKDGAASFLRLYPSCPADVDWLINDFKNRV